MLCLCRKIIAFSTWLFKALALPSSLLAAPVFGWGLFFSGHSELQTLAEFGQYLWPKSCPKEVHKDVHQAGDGAGRAMTLVLFSPLEMYQFSIVETAPVGTAIGRVKAEDSDVGENTDMTYQMKDEEGVEMFKVTTDSNTQEAVITVQKVRRKAGCGEGRHLQEGPFLCGLLLRLS